MCVKVYYVNVAPKETYSGAIAVVSARPATKVPVS